MDRRSVLVGMTAGVAAGVFASGAAAAQGEGMYGTIGKMMVAEGQRDTVIEAILGGSGTMPGCLSYIVAHDPADANAIWITEVWLSKEAHANSLKLPGVQAAIAKARPFITGMTPIATTVPVGGIGFTTRQD